MAKFPRISLLVALLLPAVACSGGASATAGSSGSESGSESSSDGSETSGPSTEGSNSEETGEVEPLPPDGCVLDIDPSCTEDSFACSGGPELGPELGVAVCTSVVFGPRKLGLGQGVAACGCPSPTLLEAHDLDGDGADELIAGCSDTGRLLIWPGRLDGYFACGQAHAVAGAPRALWRRDFDEDGLDDLVTLDPNGFASLLPALGPGELGIYQPLGKPHSAPASAWLSSTVEIDIDGGEPELLVLWIEDYDLGGAIVVMGAEGGELSVQAGLFPTPASRLTTGDLDGDGWRDLVAFGPQASFWARGSASGLAEFEPLMLEANAHYGVFGDLDGDGIDDLALGGAPPEFLIGMGDGSFGPVTSVPDPDAPGDVVGGAAMVVRDFDGDGLGDLVLGAYQSGWNIWRSSDAGLHFDQGSVYESVLFAAGDFNGDGRVDLASTPVLYSGANGQVTYWRNKP